MLSTIQSYLTGNVLRLLIAILALGFIVFSLLFGKRFWRLVRARSLGAEAEGRTYSSVQFYERLISLMEQRGLLRDRHLTPLEFAQTLKSNEAVLVTRAYNRVRFGGERLSATEKKEVERALFALEQLEM